VIVAGGLETMSMIPMGGHIIRPNPYLVEHYPDFYLNMGLATENVARKYEVSAKSRMSLRCVRINARRRRSMRTSSRTKPCR
jgi:acetyl-CoA acetyltransferase